MKTVIVEIDSQDGLDLLQDLERLNVLRIVRENVLESQTKRSEKYKGVFSKEDAASFNQHTETMRKEWDNI